MTSLPYNRSCDTMIPLVRWMVRRDTQSILDIEEKSFDYPWSGDDFIKRLRVANNIGLVLELNEDVVGYCVYGTHKLHMDILRLAVRPDLRRIGCGQRILRNLKDKAERHQARKHIITTVCESSLEAQLFFKSQGFQASLPVVKDAETGLDGYSFKWRASECSMA